MALAYGTGPSDAMALPLTAPLNSLSSSDASRASLESTGGHMEVSVASDEFLDEDVAGSRLLLVLEGIDVAGREEHQDTDGKDVHHVPVPIGSPTKATSFPLTTPLKKS